MKKQLMVLMALCTPILFLAQVGINTTTPQGTLDIVTTNNTGLVLPRVDSVEDVTDGQGNGPVDGATVFDISRNSTCFFYNGAWSCIDNTNPGNPVIVTVDTSFKSDYIKASNTQSNDTFSQIAISNDGNTLVVGAFFEDSCATGINGDQTNNGCVNSGAAYVFSKTAGIWTQQAYIKASNTGSLDEFGVSLAISSDGNTLAIGARRERSCATGINGNQTNNSCVDAGAVYVFSRSAGIWSQETYLKASNTESGDLFGWKIAISGDGNTLAVGAYNEDSCATGINGNQNNNGCTDASAVYLFTRTVGVWNQQAYIKASNTEAYNHFGGSIAISNNGNTLAVGSEIEESCATGIGGDQTSNGCPGSGAVYLFTRTSGVWSQQAYIKASNTEAGDYFGFSVAISGDGNTLAVGAYGEDSCAIGIGGNQANNGCYDYTGAVYIFSRYGNIWNQQAYIKASNTDVNDRFGTEIIISSDGNTVAVGAYGEDSCAKGIGGDQTNNGCGGSGAVYLFRRNAGVWNQQAYIKASNTEFGDFFGNNLAISSAGNILAVGASFEDSCATGIGGDQTNNGCNYSGAVYVYTAN